MRTLAILAAASSLAVAAHAADLPEALRNSIASGNQEWIDGLEKHDAARIAATYDEKALNCGADGKCVAGRAAFEKQTAARIGKLGVVKDAWVKSARTELDGDLAYEWGRAGFQANGKRFEARYLTVWRRQADGSWKIFRNIVLPG